MKTQLAVLLLVLTVASCASLRESNPEISRLEFEEVYNNSLGGGGPSGPMTQSIIVCNTQSELDSVRTRMSAGYFGALVMADVTADFENETLIGYFHPLMNSGGYTLTADSLLMRTEKGVNKYSVHYTLGVPVGTVTLAMMQPYIFIKTSKLEGTVEYIVTPKEYKISFE